MTLGKIAVLGGGPGSQGTAGDLALRGFEVHFWGRNPRKLASLFRFKQIRMVGSLEGVAQLAAASDDLEQTLKGARLVVVALPGFAQREMAERCAPYAEDGQVFLICGNSAMGSYEFTRVFREKGVDKDFLCAEWSGIPRGGRLLEPDVINSSMGFEFQVQHYSPRVGIYPARRTAEAMEVISQAYQGIRSAENCLASSLSNRATMHQAVVMLLSASAIEQFVYWDITAEGHTPSAIKLIRAINDERKGIQQAWGFEVTEVYGQGHLSGEKIDWEPIRPHRAKSAWKDRLDMRHRFITEAVPYDHALRSSAAAKAGLNLPVTDSLIRVFSVINGEDYFSTGRTLNSFGLGELSVEEVRQHLYEGN